MSSSVSRPSISIAWCCSASRSRSMRRPTSCRYCSAGRWRGRAQTAAFPPRRTSMSAPAIPVRGRATGWRRSPTIARPTTAMAMPRSTCPACNGCRWGWPMSASSRCNMPAVPCHFPRSSVWAAKVSSGATPPMRGAFDRGAVFRNELRLPAMSFPSSMGTLSPYLFFDMGRGVDNFTHRGATIASSGVGGDYRLGDRLSLGLNSAWAIRDGARTQAGEWRAQIRTTVNF
ncbi:ShlB/FhaC/HecB family hemolysin secretion/activation protein [Sphingomonas sp. SORGH_AS_0879]|uniref:ShlB/FhaC/HecB family hemolysin secretion/activation protein n=1 Tax=Sphingomonas sp. SORGH_AS_0879 TaxID=3041790 RepID=UPI0035938111